jgi:hypothetical protein
MRSIPKYLHFQRLRTTAIRHFLRRKKLSKESRWRLLLIGGYAKKHAARFPESRKARKGKEIESASERVRTVTRGKAAIEPNLAVEDLVLRAGNIEVLKRNDLLTTPIAKDGTSAPVM